MFEVVEELETELGRPPYGCEIGYRYRKTRAWVKESPFYYNFILCDMARDDIFWVDA
jgi:hypothetical protein